MRLPVAKAGYPFIIASGAACLFFAGWDLKWLMGISLLTFVFMIFFFRDPSREIPEGSELVVAPADGKVISVEKVKETPFVSETAWKLSIFMTVFNVHINRIPFGGTVAGVRYSPGSFIPADKQDASKQNEKNMIWIRTEDHRNICVVQVAGLIARRIICRLKGMEQVVRGERFGLICFGSRVDTYLPENAEIAVKPGDRVQGGTSIMGYLK
ncbi:MAG: phosphatidylserine decarboxylase family protein [Thermodesulfobacteriota bacterium]